LKRKNIIREIRSKPDFRSLKETFGEIPHLSVIPLQIKEIKIKVVRSEEACALGAAMCAAVASGGYSTVQQAQEKMGNGFEKEYKPNVKNHNYYKKTV
jgi:L-ribulokinase